jgi:hypothetical protein
VYSVAGRRYGYFGAQKTKIAPVFSRERCKIRSRRRALKQAIFHQA